ncbi:Disease resistance protein RGA2 [Camellia lanceoleosa]|uniref:Disease resistance protein RGA2 n=1 Tax=Camellia lanceoleosa TaxID=1840588 RepID=A0ACC0F927_9ERIC|nr:Disease resistance protein RGA2 [Camellia lanceoleosa]
MSLRIEYLPNLRSLNDRGLQLLGSLKYMKIVGCPQLQSLLKEGLPTSLFMLELIGCPMLKPRYLKGEGQDWHKIACVPVIHMDGEAIFEQLTLRPDTLVRLGFLPRNVAKWVAPLSDSGLFKFSGYVYSKEGPSFLDISKVVQSEHVYAICSLVASIQRSTGL